MGTGICESGTSQSPINIRTESVVECAGNCDLQFFYRSSICSLVNNSGNIVMEYDAGSYVNYMSVIYELDKISFSVPASHKIDGTTYPMEMWLWHKSMDVGKVLIVSVFIETNEATTASKDFFSVLGEGLPKRSGDTVDHNTPEEWNIWNAIPDNKAFYLYQGSLPQPPCSENVTWIIMDASVNISYSVYKAIKDVIGKNSRQIQRRNGRTVYYNSATEPKYQRNYGSKLRCYTDAELRKTCQCMCGEGQKVNNYPQLNAGLLLLILVAVLAVSILIIIWRMGLFSGIKERLRNYIQGGPIEVMTVENVNPVPMVELSETAPPSMASSTTTSSSSAASSIAPSSQFSYSRGDI